MGTVVQGTCRNKKILALTSKTFTMSPLSVAPMSRESGSASSRILSGLSERKKKEKKKKKGEEKVGSQQTKICTGTYYSTVQYRALRTGFPLVLELFPRDKTLSLDKRAGGTVNNTL